MEISHGKSNSNEASTNWAVVWPAMFQSTILPFPPRTAKFCSTAMRLWSETSVRPTVLFSTAIRFAKVIFAPARRFASVPSKFCLSRKPPRPSPNRPSDPIRQTTRRTNLNCPWPVFQKKICAPIIPVRLPPASVKNAAANIVSIASRSGIPTGSSRCFVLSVAETASRSVN